MKTVFGNGQSELLNAVARLAIFYEDLRLELGEIRDLHRRVIEQGEADLDYRTTYFLRRALATLIEFRGALTTIRKTEEFKRAEPGLTPLDASHIVNADRYLQQNWSRLKALRNEFAGHVQAAAVDFAMKNVSSEVAKVTWNPDPDGWSAGIECHFAAVVVAGAICYKLQSGKDVRAEFREALEVIGQAFNYVQAAMVALVHAFLWDRFIK
jgi:hypothetical protein